jgi:hypothetical protein
MAGLLPLPVGLDGTTQTQLGPGRVIELELLPISQFDPVSNDRP